jgi:tetratricopeptide (TPR) repeat protein
MPRLATEIRHAATTDHRIPRTPDAARGRSLPPPVPAWSPLLAFESLVVGGKQSAAKASPPPASQEQRDASKAAGAEAIFADPEAERNFAMALVMGADAHPGIVDSSLLTHANTILARAIARDPSDLAARQALALVLAKARRIPQALAQLDAVLAREPNRESALELAATVFASERRWSSAADLWRKARDVNPSIARYWTELALCQSRLANWDACKATCEAAIERFPDSFGARQMLIECHLVAGRTDEAQQEYDRLIALNPPKLDSVRQWWQEHPRRRLAKDAAQ